MSDGNHGSIGDSWPIAVSGYPRGTRVGCGTERARGTQSLTNQLRLAAAGDDVNRTRIFLDELRSMKKGDPKRDDFLRKLSDYVRLLAPEVGVSLVHATMHGANEYVYDSIFIGMGEAGHVLRIIIRVSEKMPKAARAHLLSQSIIEATDDTMALRVLTNLTGKRSDFDLDVSFAELYPAFIKRMRRRYGREVDAASIDLSASDPFAFNLWGSAQIKGDPVTIDPEDRLIQYDFWRRYIGNSRARLAQDFQGSVMPVGVYTEDPAPSVENKMSLDDLRRFYDDLPTAEPLTDSEEKSLRMLSRFLKGDFKHGIDINQLSEPESVAAEETRPPAIF